MLFRWWNFYLGCVVSVFGVERLQWWLWSRSCLLGGSAKESRDCQFMAISLRSGENKAEKLFYFCHCCVTWLWRQARCGGSPPGTSMVARSHNLLVFLYLTHDLSLNASPFVKLVALGTADRAMWSRERLGWLLRSSLAACELGDRSGCVMCPSSEILGLCLLVFFLSVCVAHVSA